MVRPGRGGPVMGWLLDQVFADERVRRVVAEPDVRNRRMIHVFERCGFRRAGELDLPDKRAALMVHERGATP
jgi:RimJ/RimL family protein N-acetyltransferase